MTRKHFELIASRIRSQLELDSPVGGPEALEDLAYGLAADFEEVNPGFDTARFVKACGF